MFAVTMMPFSTGLMAEFIRYRSALAVYCANILLFGLLLFASWRYSRWAGLVREDGPEGVARSIECRIVIA